MTAPVLVNSRPDPRNSRCRHLIVALAVLAVTHFGAGQGLLHATEVEPSIGVAEMRDDQTIVLLLRAEEGDGAAIGEAQLVYPPDHPQYEEILEHLGDLEPGDSISVRPWPGPGEPKNEEPCAGRDKRNK